MGRFKYFTRTLLVLLLVSHIECGRSGGGSRSSSGGSRSSSRSSSSHTSTSHSSPSHTSISHSSPSHTSISHSSPSISHSSPSHSYNSGTHSLSTFGSGTHSSSGGGFHSSPGNTFHTSGGGSHTSFGSGSHPPNTHTAPSAPSLPGYTVTGGAGFVPHSSGASKPIGFDHVNQQAHNAKPPTPGGIGFDHHQQTHNTPLNSGKPSAPSIQPSYPIHSAPPGYTVTGGSPIASKPNGIGFDHVNQQAHNTQLNNKPYGFQPPSHPVNSGPPGYTVTGGVPTNKPPGAIGFDHVNQQAHAGAPITPQHYNPTHSGTGFTPSPPHYQPSYPSSRPGIGFDHVNHQAAHPTYKPYRPQTIVQPSGYVHYQPPVQLQYTPPVTVLHSTTHYVPVYQPSVIQTYSSGGGSLLSHGGSFLGGYLVGRLSSSDHGFYHSHNGYQNTHITNNYYDNNYQGSNTGIPSNNNGGGGNGGSGGSYNSYYTVHHYHQNREQVPTRFSVPGEDLTQCVGNATEQLCVPNTNAFCLRNGTIMCTTPSLLTTPCGANSTERCVYSRIDCNGSPACNTTANQTFIDFYLPCISNVTYVDNKVVDSTPYKAQGSYELCVTAIAHPKKLESPVISIASLFAEFGRWHLEQLNTMHNKSNSVLR